MYEGTDKNLPESLQPIDSLSQMDVTYVPQSPVPSEVYRSIENRSTLDPTPLS